MSNILIIKEMITNNQLNNMESFIKNNNVDLLHNNGFLYSHACCKKNLNALIILNNINENFLVKRLNSLLKLSVLMRSEELVNFLLNFNKDVKIGKTEGIVRRALRNFDDNIFKLLYKDSRIVSSAHTLSYAKHVGNINAIRLLVKKDTVYLTEVENNEIQKLLNKNTQETIEAF